MTDDRALFLRNHYLGLLRNNSCININFFNAVPEEQRHYPELAHVRSAAAVVWHIACSDVWFFDSIVAGCFAIPDESIPDGVDTVSDMAEWYKTTFDKRVRAIESMEPAQLSKPIDFDGTLCQPAVLYLGVTVQHTVYHRGQLCTLLRLMGASVPPIYSGKAALAIEAFKGLDLSH